MVHGDNRTCFRQSIPLDYGKTAAFPELFKLRIQPCTADDESPEFPSEPSMYLPVAPKPRRNAPRFFLRLEIALHLSLQVFENARDTYDGGDPIRADELDDS